MCLFANLRDGDVGPITGSFEKRCDDLLNVKFETFKDSKKNVCTKNDEKILPPARLLVLRPFYTDTYLEQCNTAVSKPVI